MIRAGIVGARGFTGLELIRLLSRHPETSIAVVTSETLTHRPLSDVYPQFAGITDLTLQSADSIEQFELDVVFLALPHGVSMQYVKTFRPARFRMIDLSGDFRLTSPEVYAHWYQREHTCPEGFDAAVYGLPELHREMLKGAYLTANPGCYPTAAILGIAPFIKSKSVVIDSIIIDAKSGLTGAGVKASATTHYSNVNDNFRAYALKTHRHTIEIEEQLSKLAGRPVIVQFTPHLLPVDRGILATVYMQVKSPMSDARVTEILTRFYTEHPFVRLQDRPVSLKDVRGTNYCDIYATYDSRTQRIIVLAAIDNLVKGAAGQAVQNLNIMFGVPETTGLEHVALTP